MKGGVGVDVRSFVLELFFFDLDWLICRVFFFTIPSVEGEGEICFAVAALMVAVFNSITSKNSSNT